MLLIKRLKYRHLLFLMLFLINNLSIDLFVLISISVKIDSHIVIGIRDLYASTL